MIYLDNAATTFPKPEVVYIAMDDYLRNKCVNAGRGSYKLSKDAMKLIDETRELVSELVHLRNSERVIFTSSATLAINQILNGLEWNKITSVFVTPFEHNAIMRTLHYLQKKHNFEINIIPFDNSSFELEYSKAKIMFAEKRPQLVLMSHVSNVTGFILPIKELVKLSKENDAITLIDCAQSLGVVNLDINEIGCDFIVFAGHKSMYGPMGIAGYIDNTVGFKLKNFIVGGTGSDSKNLDMPEQFNSRYEPGSYNSYAIAGLNAALKWIKEVSIEKIYIHKKELTERLIEGLEQIEEVQMYLPKDRSKHIGTIALNIDGYKSEEVTMILNDEFDIAVRSGHHCAPLIGDFIDEEAKEGTVRISLGFFNTNADISNLIEAIQNI